MHIRTRPRGRSVYQTYERLRKRARDCEDHTDFSSSVNKKINMKVTFKRFSCKHPQGRVVCVPTYINLMKKFPRLKRIKLSPDNKWSFSLAIICLVFYLLSMLFIHSFIHFVSQSVIYLFIYLFIHSLILSK